MVPIAQLYVGSACVLSATREARAASGSAVAVVEPSAKTVKKFKVSGSLIT